jgi:predicted TIM-barrel fold metal-dependent hydrolase
VQVCDAHCHFFSSRFLELLTKDRRDLAAGDRAGAVASMVGWDHPGTAGDLADRWIAELDRHGVDRAVLMASLPGDEPSVAAAVAAYPSRFVGFFMFNPAAADAAERLARALDDSKLRGVCLFPAMHHYVLDDERVVATFEGAAARGAVVFVHCGMLSVGVRKKLGMASPFDMRLGDPLAVAAVAARFPAVKVIIPHFGAGFFREALMAADACRNVYLDTSSSNAWMKYHPGLTLEGVFRQALDVAGPDRLLFGTDSSFFPRGWQRPVFEQQKRALETLGIPDDVQQRIFSTTFQALFPTPVSS